MNSALGGGRREKAQTLARAFDQMTTTGEVAQKISFLPRNMYVSASSAQMHVIDGPKERTQLLQVQIAGAVDAHCYHSRGPAPHLNAAPEGLHSPTLGCHSCADFVCIPQGVHFASTEALKQAGNSG